MLNFWCLLPVCSICNFIKTVHDLPVRQVPPPPCTTTICNMSLVFFLSEYLYIIATKCSVPHTSSNVARKEAWMPRISVICQTISSAVSTYSCWLHWHSLCIWFCISVHYCIRGFSVSIVVDYMYTANTMSLYSLTRRKYQCFDWEHGPCNA